MTKWPVQKQTNRTAQKRKKPRRNRPLDKKPYFLFFGIFFLELKPAPLK